MKATQKVLPATPSKRLRNSIQVPRCITITRPSHAIYRQTVNASEPLQRTSPSLTHILKSTLPNAQIHQANEAHETLGIPTTSYMLLSTSVAKTNRSSQQAPLLTKHTQIASNQHTDPPHHQSVVGESTALFCYPTPNDQPPSVVFCLDDRPGDPWDRDFRLLVLLPVPFAVGGGVGGDE